ncbi:hypothetical protein [uncultured Parvimonas sp.]|uniref:hypothetical protein n=1 Tax=Parvimonas parva TaxID=2769485 RepID=UPI002599293B|nr:hypothetical protein [uncultured Parvimonas sp.]
MLGLRTKESDKFLKFFSKVQEKANLENKVFFLDFGECKDIEFEDMEIDTLFGWLVPKNLSKDFELSFNCGRIEEKWDDFYNTVDFEIKNKSLNIKFN